MLNDLNWESLESHREQFSLSMLYNILKQNTYLPPEYTPEFHPQTSLQTRARHMFYTNRTFLQYGHVLILIFIIITKTVEFIAKLHCTVESFKSMLQHYFYALILYIYN